MPETYYTQLQTPIGKLTAKSCGTGITGLHITLPQPTWIQNNDLPIFQELHQALHEYFKGTRHTFTSIILSEGTDFQLRVWLELCKIPYGDTINYTELANRINKPTAARAVAQAAHRNPILILIPCHRLVGIQSISGYAAGEKAKRFLLAHEQQCVESNPTHNYWQNTANYGKNTSTCHTT